MKAITLYEDKNSLLNKIDPFSKLLYVLVTIIIPIIIGIKDIKIVFIITSLMLLITNKVIKKIIPLLSFAVIIILTAVIIQGMFRAGNITVAFRLGPMVFYKEGLIFAYQIALNVLNLLLAFAVFIFTTKPTDLVNSLVKAGLSPRFGYILSSVFQIIPQMSETMSKISDAQRSRGMETEGNLRTRVKAFFSLISPVVMSSLITTRERAIALEVRGFTSTEPKVFLYEPMKTKRDILIKIVLLLLILSAVVGRVILWLK